MLNVMAGVPPLGTSVALTVDVPVADAEAIKVTTAEPAVVLGVNCVNPAFVMPSNNIEPTALKLAVFLAVKGKPIILKSPDAVVCVNALVVTTQLTVTKLFTLLYVATCTL